MSGRKILFVVLIAAVIGAAVYWGFKGNEKGPRYKTEKVQRGDIQESISATGTVNPVTTVLVGTQVSGTIKEIKVDFNSRVKKGQLIALIDPSNFESQVEQARANLQSARANLQKAEVSLSDAGRTLGRSRELFAKGMIARSDLDAAETNHDTAKVQMGAAKAQVEQTSAALRISETNLRYTRILSPVDGIVISRNVDVGQTVAASFQTPTLFNIAQDLTKMQIDTNVDEADIGRVKVGQDVEFTVDAYPETTFKGRVLQVRNAPITVQNVVTYDVVINVDNTELKLKPGMTANVSIIISTKDDVLKVPNSALRFKPDKDTASRTKVKGEVKETGEKKERGDKKSAAGRKGPAVWIPDKGKPRRVQVEAGISDGSFTEIISGELKEGQDVITESLTKPKEAQTYSGPRMF